MTKNQTLVIGGLLAVIAIAAVATAASYMTKSSLSTTTAAFTPTPTPVATTHVVHRYQPAGQTTYQRSAPPCNDHNIVGTVGGGLAGALVGNQFGHGSGKTIATVGGAAGGAYLGNEYIPTRGVACN